MKKQDVIIINDEIIPKGKCYIMINDLKNDEENQVFKNVLDKEYKSDSIMYFLSCKDITFDHEQAAINLKDYRLNYYTDMIQLEKKLVKTDSAFITKELDDESCNTFKHEHNKSFFHVPCSATYTVDSLREKMIDENIGVGLIYNKETHIGTYEINYSNEVAEIEGLSIHVKHQDKGYGKQALEAIEVLLISEGYEKVLLTVASLNEKAYDLYLKSGYQVDTKRSRWYKVNRKSRLVKE